MSRFPDVKHPGGFFANHRLALIAGGVAMLASALIVRRKTGNAEREHPPLGKIVDVDGVRLHYVARGCLH